MMSALPLKHEYRPTLGELLGPRWRHASAVWRVAVTAGMLLLAGLVVAVVLTVSGPTFSGGDPVRFSFGYKGLYRTSPDPGGFAKVQRVRDGALEDSFAVGPLELPPYTGEPGAELPLYAHRYIRALASRYQGFQLRGEGKTQIDSLPPYAVYNVFYTARVRGREMFGRDVLVLAEHPGRRTGVAITMLATAEADRQVSSPLSVGTKGTLEAPLGSFALE